MSSVPQSVTNAVDEIVEAYKDKICKAVSEGLYEAAARSLSHHENVEERTVEMLRNSLLDDHTLEKLMHETAAVMSKRGLRVSPSKWNLDEYESAVDPKIVAAIKDGSMDIIDVCHSDVGRRVVDQSYTEEGAAVHDIQISANRIVPYSAKIINSILCANRSNALMACSTGDNAKYVSMLDLLDFSTAFKSTHEMSLPTMLVSLNTSGKKPQASDAYFFPDHKDNRIGGSENVQTSGHAFLGAVRLAEAWNALVFEHYNRPIEGTDMYDLFQRDSLSVTDVKATLGAMALLAKHQPEKTDRYMQLCYGHISDQATVKPMDTQLLQQHVTSMRTDEEKERRWALHLDTQKQKVSQAENRRLGIPQVRLSYVEDYKWAHPEDLPTARSVGKPVTKAVAEPKKPEPAPARRQNNTSPVRNWRRSRKTDDSWRKRA